MTGEIDSFWASYDPVSLGSKVCRIYRVPRHIREIDRIAYEPIVISFGPYHYGAQNLQDMEKQKLQHLDRVLKLNCERTLHDYIKAMAKLEKEARKSYSEEVTTERKKYLQMLLLDGCFLLVNIDENVGTRVSNSRAEQSFSLKAIGGDTTRETVTDLRDPDGVGCSKYRGNGCAMDLELIKVEVCQEGGRNTEVEDTRHRPIMENNANAGDWLANFVWHDIFLLENQIPFFVVESIYQLVATQGTLEFLRSKTAGFVEDILSHYPKAIQESDRPKHFYHLLHLCHMYFKPTYKVDQEHQRLPKLGFFHRFLHVGHKYLSVGHKPSDSKKNLELMDCFQGGKLRSRWRRAVEYSQAGIRFKRKDYDRQNSHSLLDISFLDGVIEVPCVPIDESTESLFKNLVALEQTDPRFGNDISAYVTFMSQIIATPDDAMMLVQKGIIVHMLDSDEEVADLFARVTKQVSFRFYGKYYLKSVCQRLEAHYQSRLNRWIAWLWLNHFKNPWLALAAIAAIVVLICTIVQTIYTVLAYVKPPSNT